MFRRLVARESWNHTQQDAALFCYLKSSRSTSILSAMMTVNAIGLLPHDDEPLHKSMVSLT